MIRGAAWSPLLLVLVACAPDERPPLSECAFGLYWAECGGNGEPALGCDRETGDCRWFDGGQTARGYAVSDCPVPEPCCHDGWPFADYAPADRSIRRHASAQLSVLRQAVVSRGTVNDVDVVADLEGETSVGLIRCGADIFPGCDTGGGWVSGLGEAVVLTAGAPWGSSGLWYRLEIVPSRSPEAWTVRLYRFGAMLDEGQELFLVCEHLTVAQEVPLSGVLHVNTLETSDVEAFHGRLEATTDLGAEFTVEF